MRVFAALFTASTVMCCAVVGAGCAYLVPYPAHWPAATSDPLRWYLALAAGPTGDAWELFAVVAVVFFLCFTGGGLAYLFLAWCLRKLRALHAAPVEQASEAETVSI